MEEIKIQIEKLLDNSTWNTTEFNFTYKFISNTVWINNKMIGEYNLTINENNLYLNFGGKNFIITLISDYEIELNDGKSFFRVELATI